MYITSLHTRCQISYAFSRASRERKNRRVAMTMKFCHMYVLFLTHNYAPLKMLTYKINVCSGARPFKIRRER